MLITPIRLTYGKEGDNNKGKDKIKYQVEEVDDDLKKPYKQVLKSPFTKRIIEFFVLSHQIPMNLKIYDSSTDPDDHITRFVGAVNQGEWEMPVWCRMFQQTLDGPAKGCKDLTKVSKIFWIANETLSDFKECWTKEMGYIHGVLEEAYKSTELPKGENLNKGQGTPYRGPWPPRIVQSGGPPQVDDYNTHNRRGFGKKTKGILAIELHLQLPPCPPIIEMPKKENLDRYCDYHEGKQQYTNDCY
uniref:Reverse transcriptase domain-containing protein n=1 Tax=Tanacetum cinerariifolium TaxID=118510 RepID=A0A6L2J866_TANCI|nr:hypothetical protein [Tanacetum cinerariifolium]